MTTQILLVIAAVAKAVMDRAKNGSLPKSWGDFWDESVAWKFKWRLPDVPVIPLNLKERFPGSSTVFVFVTSGFHLAQFVFLNSMFLALVFYTPICGRWIDFVVLSVGFRIVFEASYRIIKA